MEKDKEPLWEVWATRLLNAATVVVLGYFVLFVDFSGHGRLWDKVAAYIPGASVTAPTAAAPGRVAAARLEDGADRTLIIPEKAPPAAEEPQPAEPPQTAAAAPAKAPTPRLTSSLRKLSTFDESSQTSAGISGAPGVQPAAAPAQAPAPAVAAPAAAGSAQVTDIAARTSYGSASRNEVMGKAAGPVYNLKGKSKK